VQQELLKSKPQVDLRIYAVWFNMYPGDARAKWPSSLLTDSRVAHYWDEPKAVGGMYLSQLPAIVNRRAAATRQVFDGALWDAFFLYERGVQWQERLPLPVRWGYPIMATKDEFRQEIERLAGR
jgi:hypothetical protein